MLSFELASRGLFQTMFLGMSCDEWTRERKTGWELDGVLVMPYIVALTLYVVLLMLAPVM